MKRKQSRRRWMCSINGRVCVGPVSCWYAAIVALCRLRKRIPTRKLHKKETSYRRVIEALGGKFIDLEGGYRGK